MTKEAFHVHHGVNDSMVISKEECRDVARNFKHDPMYTSVYDPKSTCLLVIHRYISTLII